MTKTVLSALILLTIVPALAFARSEKAIVRATGQAPAELLNAREAAVEDALRQAVEAGAGVEIASATQTRDFRLIEDVIYMKTAGLVEKYEVLQENPNQDGLYTVRIEATVSRADINTKLEAWKALIKRKGHPRVMVVGTVDRQPFERRITAEIQNVLEQKGLTVVDLDMLKENQRRDAERAAKGDLDPAKAALIMREIGTDYFVTIGVEGTAYPAKPVHGIEMYPVDATAILKVIAVDTAELIASQVESQKFQAETKEQALREVTSQVTKTALENAIRRIAAHWLEDVDYRGGAQIEIVAVQFDFERLDNLIKGLRAAGGIKDIMVDSTDYQGRSQIRVITNSPTFNIASVLKQVDPDIIITSASKYRVELAAGTGSSSLLKPRVWLAIAAGLIAIGVVIVAARKLLRGQNGRTAGSQEDDA